MPLQARAPSPVPWGALPRAGRLVSRFPESGRPGAPVLVQLWTAPPDSELPSPPLLPRQPELSLRLPGSWFGSQTESSLGSRRRDPGTREHRLARGRPQGQHALVDTRPPSGPPSVAAHGRPAILWGLDVVAPAVAGWLRRLEHRPRHKKAAGEPRDHGWDVSYPTLR